MSELTERIYEDFEAQNEMVRSALDLFLDTLPTIADNTQKIAEAVAGGISATGSESNNSDKSGGGQGGGQAANVDFTKLADSLGSISKGLLEFNVVAGGGTKFVKFIKGLTKALTLDGELKDPTAVATLYTSFGNSIKAVGSSLGSMSAGMLLFAVANAIGGPAAFQKFFDEFFTQERIKSFSGKDAEAFGKNLIAVSSSLKTTAITLALLTPAMIIAIPGLLLLTPAMAVVHFATKLIGNDESIKNMEGFTKSMTWFGIGLSTFILAAIASRLVEPQDLLMLAGIVGTYLVTSVLFAFVDKFSGGGKVFESAAKGIAFMSLGLLTFELAALGTRILTLEDIGKVTLIGLSLAMVSLLMSAVGKQAEQGAKAMIIVAASLIVAELAVWMIQALDLNAKSYAIAAGMMMALGFAAWFVGKRGKESMLGATAMILVGASLIVASVGVLMLKDVSMKSIAVAAGVITALGLAAVVVGSQSEFALLGAAAIMIIAVSLVVAAAGIKMFEDMDGGKIKKNMKKVIWTAGSELAKLSVISPLILIGSAAALAAGAALLVIGKGIEKFTELGVDLDALGGENGSIPKLLNSIIVPFEELGKKYTFDSISSFLLGGGNPLVNGINMCKGIGDVLCDIASGVKKFSKLEFKNSKGETITMADGDFDKVAENLAKVITCVSNAFIEVGKNNEYDLGGDASSIAQGLFTFANNLVGSNPLQNAIKNFSGIGEVVNGIASGLKGFSELKFGDTTFSDSDFSPTGKITTNIKTAITCVASAFTDAWKIISPSGEGEGIVGAAKSLFSGDIMGVLNNLGSTPLEKAIASFSGISEISEGIINIVDKLGKNAGDIDSNQIKTNIANVISGMVGGFESMKNIDEEGLESRKKYVSEVSKSIVNIAKNSDGLEKSAAAMEKICDSLNKSFDIIKELADEKLQNVKEIFDALVQLEEKESTRISEKMEKFGDMVNSSSASSSSYTSSSVSEVSTSGNAKIDDKNNKDDKTLSNKEIASQIAMISQMLNDINTKLGGTLNVAVEENAFGTYRR